MRVALSSDQLLEAMGKAGLTPELLAGEAVVTLRKAMRGRHPIASIRAAETLLERFCGRAIGQEMVKVDDVRTRGELIRDAVRALQLMGLVEDGEVPESLLGASGGDSKDGVVSGSNAVVGLLPGATGGQGGAS